VVQFGSDRRLTLPESHFKRIRFDPGKFIRFSSGFYSSKVMAKLQNSLVLSCGGVNTSKFFARHDEGQAELEKTIY
jgi:hypothetical protein